MGDLGPGFFNKPRYRHEVLIGNWYEDRALRDPSFLPSTTSHRQVTVDTVVRDEVRPSSATLNGLNGVNGAHGKETMDSTNTQQMNNGTKDFSVNPGDPARGYYATTYKRAYGPRTGYIHFDSFPSSTEDFAARREAALHPENMDSTSQETTMNNSINSNCLRCEQIARSKENSECLRCVQLAGL